MNKSPTIRDIAAATGFSRSTVSAALRGRSDIAVKTRKSVRKAAEEMGYFQDPELQRLMTHLRKGRSTQNRIPLALMVACLPDQSWENMPWNVLLWQGVKRRCEQLGFTIEIVNATRLQSSGKSLESILKARGIQGLVFEGSFDLKEGPGSWVEVFACVRMGTHPWKTPFHSACPDFAYNVHHALDRLWMHGFRRPGLALTNLHESRSDDLYLAGYLAWWARHSQESSPVEFLKYNETEGSAFREWLAKEKPDVVLVNDNRVRGWLPEEIRPVHLNLADDVKGWWGIDQGRDRIGEAAIDILSAQFVRGERGCPEQPRSILVRGNWSEG